MPPREPSASRRDFLSGRALRAQAEHAAAPIADALRDAVAETAVGARAEPNSIPVAGPTVRLETRAMACSFAVVLNPGPPRQVMAASHALDMIHELEAQLTVYRPESEMSLLNARAATEAVLVEPRLYELL